MLLMDWKERIARADPCIFTYMDGWFVYWLVFMLGWKYLTYPKVNILNINLPGFQPVLTPKKKSSGVKFLFLGFL